MSKNLFLILIAAVLFAGCSKTLNPSVMFQTSRYDKFAEDSLAGQKSAFVFAPQDRFEMRVFTNNGFTMVDVTQMSTSLVNSSFTYQIDRDSLTKLPLLGKINLTGLTLDSAQKKLEELYSKYFIDPFIVLKITNRVIYVFLGEGGQGAVVNLQDDHTSLIEALAQAGGISESGKAYKIKIIRGNLKNPQVYFVDLSTMEGVKNSNLYVQSGDIIYIEPTSNVAAKITAQITPFIGLLTAILLVVSLVNL
jgi:polysaccharide export outer membrane protein